MNQPKPTVPDAVAERAKRDNRGIGRLQGVGIGILIALAAVAIFSGWLLELFEEEPDRPATKTLPHEGTVGEKVTDGAWVYLASKPTCGGADLLKKNVRPKPRVDMDYCLVRVRVISDAKRAGRPAWLTVSGSTVTTTLRERMTTVRDWKEYLGANAVKDGYSMRIFEVPPGTTATDLEFKDGPTASGIAVVRFSK